LSSSYKYYVIKRNHLPFVLIDTILFEPMLNVNTFFLISIISLINTIEKGAQLLYHVWDKAAVVNVNIHPQLNRKFITFLDKEFIAARDTLENLETFCSQ
jgi:hypothetical protein